MDDKIEKLIQAALRKEDINVPDNDNACLEDDVFEKLYKNILSDTDRLKVLNHLDQCSHCRDDLALYMELMNPAILTVAVFEKLQCLKSALLTFVDKLALSDFKAFCGKIEEISEQIIANHRLDEVNSFLNDLFIKLNASPAALKIPLRGTTPGKENSLINPQQLAIEARQLKDLAAAQLNRAGLVHGIVENNWLGQPERWIFNRLTEPFKDKAVTIRDFCEEKLEKIGYDTRQGRLPLLGVGHTKRVLGYAVALLKAFENYFCDPLACFTIYVGCYCYDLGYTPAAEDPMRMAHYHERNSNLIDFITGKSSMNDTPNWQKMGFSSFQEAALIAGLCAGRLTDLQGQILPLPKAQTIFLEGDTLTLSARALSAILRLSNLLDLRKQRVCHLSAVPVEPENIHFIKEYIKNELVENIEIDSKGLITILIRSQYQYPPAFQEIIQEIPTVLQKDIEQYRVILKDCGVDLPTPEIHVQCSLFVQNHPYLHS